MRVRIEFEIPESAFAEEIADESCRVLEQITRHMCPPFLYDVESGEDYSIYNRNGNRIGSVRIEPAD